jgi:putative acetyltransferase
MTDEYRTRRITPADDPAVAALIRTVMPEFGASGPGFAILDPEVDCMSSAYPGGKAQYLVIEDSASRVVGGGGFAPLVGGDPDVCELRKMYFLPELRGKGLGTRLLRRLLGMAKEEGFRTCYLETLQAMTRARALYEAHGFSPLSGPRGATGHFGCDRWYQKDL